jgi:serine protease Do
VRNSLSFALILAIATFSILAGFQVFENTLQAGPAIDGQLSAEEQHTIAVYRRASPAVVHIRTLSTSLDEALNAQEQAGVGSGVIVDKRGYFITNYHVIQGIDAVQVKVPGQSASFAAKLVGQEPSLDFALLKIETPKPVSFPVIPLGDSDRISVGQQALTIGSPLGLEGTLTKGVVSSVNRPIPLSPGRDVNMIQIDASINPGNSGGALLNSRGELIGMNTLGVLPGQSSTGLNFAMPINPLKRYINGYVQQGQVQKAFLGVTLGLELSPEVARILGTSVQYGIMVESVDALSPAEQAGLRGGTTRIELEDGSVIITGGDIIVEAEGRKLLNADTLLQVMEAKRPGDLLKLGVCPGGTEPVKRLTIRLK